VKRRDNIFMRGRRLPRYREGKQQWEKGSNSSGAWDREQQFWELGTHQGLGQTFLYVGHSPERERRRRKAEAFIILGMLPAPQKHPVCYQYR